MTTYFRNVRSDFLEDMSLSPDAFRVLAYMIAQKPGFTFNLGHLQRVFGGVIGLNRLKVARRDLIAGGWLIPGQRRKVAGGQDSPGWGCGELGQGMFAQFGPTVWKPDLR